MRKYRALRDVYSSMLRVPQYAKYHPEGDALTHTLYVVRAIPRAIRALQKMKNDYMEISDILCKMDFEFSPYEMKVLKLAAYLHDIGKSTTTVVHDSGKITSYKHDQPQVFKPLIERLLLFVPSELASFYNENSDDIDFLIQYHMGFFGKSFIQKHFYNGRVCNTFLMRLLLVLMFADKMGRGSHTAIIENGINNHIESLRRFSIISRRQSNRCVNDSKNLSVDNSD